MYSPEDQVILEAAFAVNPKPDKAARMALVDRVALGEKEVQVHIDLQHMSYTESNPDTAMPDMVPKPPTEHSKETAPTRPG